MEVAVLAIAGLVFKWHRAGICGSRRDYRGDRDPEFDGCARMAANEGAAIRSLRNISSAEATYQSMLGHYGTLDELASKGLSRSDVGEWHEEWLQVFS